MTEFNRVWDALAKSKGEAELKAARSEMMMQLQKMVKDKEWTQHEAAEKFGVSQPRVSNLMTGKMSKFSLDALVEMAGNAGWTVEVIVFGDGL